MMISTRFCASRAGCAYAPGGTTPERDCKPSIPEMHNLAPHQNDWTLNSRHQGKKPTRSKVNVHSSNVWLKHHRLSASVSCSSTSVDWRRAAAPAAGCSTCADQLLHFRNPQRYTRGHRRIWLIRPERLRKDMQWIKTPRPRILMFAPLQEECSRGWRAGLTTERLFAGCMSSSPLHKRSKWHVTLTNARALRLHATIFQTRPGR
jgi:hypothetical protein